MIHENTKLTTIGICGGGKMGQSLFNLLAGNAFRIIFYLRNPHSAKAQNKKWERKKNRKKNQNSLNLSEVLITTEIEKLSEADLIIEFVSEELRLKKEIIKIIASINPTAIIATGSSSFVPSRIISDKDILRRLVGLHFFYPVPLTEHVEVIHNKDLPEQSLNHINFFLNTINRKGLFLPEEAGSILNKLLVYYQNEAFIMVFKESYPPVQIDDLIEENLFPVGPYKYFDAVGLDTILQSLYEYIKNDPFKESFMYCRRELSKLVGKGCLGKKTGMGFYSYKDNKVNPEYDFQHDNFVPKEIMERLQLILINTAFAFLEKKYIDIETLKTASYEVLQIEQGPVEIALEIGLERVRDRLRFYWNKYGRYYEPGSLLNYLANNQVKEKNLHDTLREFHMEKKERVGAFNYQQSPTKQNHITQAYRGGTITTMD